MEMERFGWLLPCCSMARGLTEPSRTIEGRRACGGERVL